MRKLLPYLLLLGFVSVALFGVTLTAPMQHEMSCPFAAGCVTMTEHLSHWQSAFAAVLAELLILASVVCVVFSRVALSIDTRDYTRYRLARLVPVRPPLLQELFSQGILHRKEPQIA